MSVPSSAAESARRAPWAQGSVIGGRYRLVAPIGRGAHGEVWRAEHLRLGSHVAVKLVHAASKPDAKDAILRFSREARTAANIKSEHVVRVIDHGVEDGIAFIAMELLEGESLGHRIATRGALLPRDAARVVWEVSRAIDQAHAMGFVHRDLKPSNVFLARDGDREIVKVLDFGIAKAVPRLLGATGDEPKTQEGLVMGTPAYMSPEQVLGKRLDHRSDLWSLAMIAFECVTGKRAFGGDSLGELFVRICESALPVPSAIARVPNGFDTWFLRAARRDPDERFASAGELAQTLAGTIAPDALFELTMPSDGGVDHQALVSPMLVRSDAWATPRRKPWSLAAIALAILAPTTLAAVSTTAWLALRGRRDEPAATTASAVEPSPPATTIATTPIATATIATTTAAPPTTAATPASSARTGSIALAPSAAPRTAAPRTEPRTSPKPSRPHDDGDIGF